MAGCSSQRILEKDELLLSTVKIESSSKHISTHSIKAIVSQKPNNKWFGIAKVPLGMYALAGKTILILSANYCVKLESPL